MITYSIVTIFAFKLQKKNKNNSAGLADYDINITRINNVIIKNKNCLYKHSKFLIMYLKIRYVFLFLIEKSIDKTIQIDR